ncbi:MAG TPA: IS200/IS605 family transposase [Candidatus Margulisiibacteriota bacterium]|nr:IS200/IS605 family transposase [Candidatus Margulisiibacteriota bacterium]
MCGCADRWRSAARVWRLLVPADWEDLRVAYWRLLYHLVWATYEREPLLISEREALLYRILGGKAAEIGVFVHATGNARDHVHLVVGIPPKLAVSECLRQLKGASSHALNHQNGPFRWQGREPVRRDPAEGDCVRSQSETTPPRGVGRCPLRVRHQ